MVAVSGQIPVDQDGNVVGDGDVRDEFRDLERPPACSLVGAINAVVVRDSATCTIKEERTG